MISSLLFLMVFPAVAETPAEFAARAKRVIEERFEERECEVVNPAELVCGDVVLGLENLRRKIVEVDAEGESVDAMILQFFGLAWAEVMRGPTAGPAGASAATAQATPSRSIETDGDLPSWEIAAPTLRPQLAPSEYQRQVGRKNLRPFVPGIEIGTVSDAADRYAYVLDRHVASWAVDRSEIEGRAAANLEAASTNLELEAQRPDDPTLAGRWLVIDLADGYAAARLILPSVRRQIAGLLGESFFVGMPNRDFLVAWSRDFAFHLDFIERVTADFEARPHPLSSKIYLATADTVREATPEEITSGVTFDWGDEE